jgi:hypothetical protein
MKKITIGLLLGTSFSSIAGADLHYLKDTDYATNVGAFLLPSIIFNRDIEIPNVEVDENGPILFQKGEEVFNKTFDRLKPYCALGGTFQTEKEESEEQENTHTFYAGDRLNITAPFTTRELSQEVHLSKKIFSEGLTTTKTQYKLDFLIRKGIGVEALGAALFKAGMIEKNLFPNDSNEYSLFNGHLICFNFTRKPTMGDIRKTVGAQNISFFPDESDRQGLNAGMEIKNEEDGATDKEDLRKMNKQMMKEMTQNIREMLKQKFKN